MKNGIRPRVRRPKPATLIGGALVAAGFLLANVDWWFILLAALGAFGPGLLRELSLLDDQDEFEREAARRAGYHAYLATGCAAFLLVAYLRSGHRALEQAQEFPALFLGMLWFTWALSSLIAYWGAQRAARRILFGFGCAWLAFAILSNIGAEWTGWPSLLLESLLTVPFFALAWGAGRWPRVSGVLLLASAAALFAALGFWRLRFGLVVSALTMLLFLGPLAGSGIALLTAARERAPDPLSGAAGGC